MAYEVMQQYHPDASNRFKSLDDIWYYDGQEEHLQEVIIPHEASQDEEVVIKMFMKRRSQNSFLSDRFRGWGRVERGGKSLEWLQQGTESPN